MLHDSEGHWVNEEDRFKELVNIFYQNLFVEDMP